MKLNAHAKGIVDCDSWETHRPPKMPERQWKDGRSAKELARYITASLPGVPVEIEEALKHLVPANAVFDWDAEYVTKLPGTGEGRNHDAVLFGEDLVVCIEAKADETLGNLCGEEMADASVNKLHRISALLDMFFKGGFKKYRQLRYQLLTAGAGAILEAQKQKAAKAVLLVIVFKSREHTEEAKLQANDRDIENFLAATNAFPAEGLMQIPNNTDVALYFGKIEIAR